MRSYFQRNCPDFCFTVLFNHDQLPCRTALSKMCSCCSIIYCRVCVRDIRYTVFTIAIFLNCRCYIGIHTGKCIILRSLMRFTHINCSISGIYFLCKSPLIRCSGKINCFICCLFHKIRIILSLHRCFPYKVRCFYFCSTCCFFQACHGAVFDIFFSDGIYHRLKVIIRYHLVVILI